jgi:hypothetical protein
VSRLVTAGVWNNEGQLVKPRVVRVGMCSSANPAVVAATLDAQVESYLDTHRRKSGAKVEDRRAAALLQEKDDLTRRMTELQGLLSASGFEVSNKQRKLEEDIDRLRVMRQRVVSQLFDIESEQRRDTVRARCRAFACDCCIQHCDWCSNVMVCSRSRLSVSLKRGAGCCSVPT